jgi:hypothetical protein
MTNQTMVARLSLISGPLARSGLSFQASCGITVALESERMRFRGGRRQTSRDAARGAICTTACLSRPPNSQGLGAEPPSVSTDYDTGHDNDCPALPNRRKLR